MDTHRAARIGNLVTFAVALSIVLAGAFVSVTSPRSFRAVDAIEAGRHSRANVLTPRVLRTDGATGSASPLGGGLFLTNWHVVNGAEEGLTLTVASGKERVPVSRLMWASRPSDLALLYVPLLRTPGFEVRCDDPRIGEPVTSIGWPYNMGYAETPGFVTGGTTRPFTLRPRYLPPHTYEGGVQWISALIGHGMSGGPVIDARNRLVGVNALGVGEFFGIVPASEICRALGRS